MGLKDIKLPQAKITVADGETFTVRGLSLRDVGVLAQRHHTPLAALYAEFTGAAELGQDAVAAKLPELLGKFPDLAADIIAISEGDIENADAVGVLPLPVQIAALDAIFTLTFRTEADLKNVVETVIRGMKSATTQMGALRAP